MLSTSIWGIKIEKIAELAFDALLIATGSMGTVDETLKGPDGHLQINPVSLETFRSGVFAAGSINTSHRTHSVIESISQGLRAAISIERYFKKASLTLGRENELAKETRIYTSLSGIHPKVAVKPADNQNFYTAEQALQESQRCLLCQCLECTKKMCLSEALRWISQNLHQRNGNQYRRPGRHHRENGQSFDQCLQPVRTV